MISKQPVCSKCYHEISKEYDDSGLLVCNTCGWVESRSRKSKEKKANWVSHFIMFGFAFALVSVFLFTDRWGDDSGTAFKFEITDVFRKATTQDYEKMFQICQNKNRHDCSVKFAQKLISLNPANTASWIFLTENAFASGNMNQAENYTRGFLKSGSSEPQGLLLAAKVFGKQSLVSESEEIFDRALKASSEKSDSKLEIEVTRAHIQMLVENEKYSEARKLIDAYRARGGTWAYFMYKEMAIIEKMQPEVDRDIAKEPSAHCGKSGFCSL